MTPDTNRLLTESGPGTPGGHVLRQYWQPAALSEELTADRPVVSVTLLGEELVLFRDELDRLGLIGRYCPHRGVDLSYGRLEGGGLRCPFHGWLFDVAGSCLETPAEPVTSSFRRPSAVIRICSSFGRGRPPRVCRSGGSGSRRTGAAGAPPSKNAVSGASR